MSNILHLSHSSFLVAYVDISFIKFCQWSVEGSWFFFFFSVFVCFPIYPCPAIQLYHINFMTLSTPTYTKKMLERKSSTNQAGHKPPFSSGLNMKKKSHYDCETTIRVYPAMLQKNIFMMDFTLRELSNCSAFAWPVEDRQKTGRSNSFVGHPRCDILMGSCTRYDRPL